MSFRGVLCNEISREEGIPDRHFLGLGLGCCFFVVVAFHCCQKALTNLVYGYENSQAPQILWLPPCFDSKLSPEMAEVTAQNLSDTPGLYKEMEP